MKILINYATVSGNSAMLAQQLMDKLKATHAQIEFVYKDSDECKGEDYNQYELIIFASSTWDDGNINMIAQEYLDGLQNVKGKKFALIGLGDSTYPHFCGAVPKTEEKLKALGAEIVGRAFKIDGLVEEAIVGKAAEWATLIIGGLKPGATPAAPAQAAAGTPQAPIPQPVPTPQAVPSAQPSTPPVVTPTPVSTPANGKPADPVAPPIPGQPAPVVPAPSVDPVAAPVVPPVPASVEPTTSISTDQSTPQ
jgi:flavodoxin I